jgi:hypothetical protein
LSQPPGANHLSRRSTKMADDILSANLVPVEGSELEFFVDKNTGRVYASIRATARIVNCNESTIRDCIAARKIDAKLAEIPTAGGTQGAQLLSAEAVFRLAILYDPELAFRMGLVRPNQFFQALCGLDPSLDGLQVLASEINIVISKLAKIHASNTSPHRPTPQEAAKTVETVRTRLKKLRLLPGGYLPQITMLATRMYRDIHGCEPPICPRYGDPIFAGDSIDLINTAIHYYESVLVFDPSA